MLLGEKFPMFRILLELLDILEEGTGWNYTRSDRASRPRSLELQERRCENLKFRVYLFTV